MWSSFNCNKNTKINKNLICHLIVVLKLLHLGLKYQYSRIFSELLLEYLHYLTTLRFTMVTARWGPLAISKLGNKAGLESTGQQELPNLIGTNIFIIV